MLWLLLQPGVSSGQHPPVRPLQQDLSSELLQRKRRQRDFCLEGSGQLKRQQQGPSSVSVHRQAHRRQQEVPSLLHQPPHKHPPEGHSLVRRLRRKLRLPDPSLAHPPVPRRQQDHPSLVLRRLQQAASLEHLQQQPRLRARVFSGLLRRLKRRPPGSCSAAQQHRLLQEVLEVPRLGGKRLVVAVYSEPGETRNDLHLQCIKSFVQYF
ncbi:hypothetical protein M427DRAFT_474091 [Gonapodya prolifera JEL478]|uniref:Uncharacterized protein n=1 Tax=Gonapodya prolifera (strain JEL478) TaxID=1344416 RepID=A0A139ARE4_GONPJ|nr:hypothetical protein M427DRAFT_474091 [Gonapodya prolifera JEL478]|eukprot:KXS19317.1 hypothetical protein M427DRAFT_474091 [Gonapodya prolifera JEL478]